MIYFSYNNLTDKDNKKRDEEPKNRPSKQQKEYL